MLPDSHQLPGLDGAGLMFRQTEGKKKNRKTHPFQPTVYLEITADWYTDIPQTEQVFITRGFGVFNMYFYCVEVSLRADGSNPGNELDFTGFRHPRLRSPETARVCSKKLM